MLLQLNRIKLGKARARGEGIAVRSGCPGQAAGEGRHVSGGGQHERDLLRRGRPAEEIQPGESDFLDDEKATLSVVAAPTSRTPTKDQKEAKGHEEAKEPVAAAYQQPCPMVP